MFNLLCGVQKITLYIFTMGTVGRVVLGVDGDASWSRADDGSTNCRQARARKRSGAVRPSPSDNWQLTRWSDAARVFDKDTSRGCLVFLNDGHHSY